MVAQSNIGLGQQSKEAKEEFKSILHSKSKTEHIGAGITWLVVTSITYFFSPVALMIFVGVIVLSTIPSILTLLSKNKMKTAAIRLGRYTTKTDGGVINKFDINLLEAVIEMYDERWANGGQIMRLFIISCWIGLIVSQALINPIYWIALGIYLAVVLIVQTAMSMQITLAKSEKHLWGLACFISSIKEAMTDYQDENEVKETEVNK